MPPSVRNHHARFTLYVLSALCVLLLVPPAAAQDYQTSPDFDLVWSLDPRDHTDLFPRGPAFGARSVLTGMDFDGDGHKEILFSADETLAPGGPDPGFMEVFLFENTGDDSYEYVWHYTHVDASNSLPPIAWGDIDSDGLFEIYLGIPTINGDPNDLFIFEQNPDGTFPDSPTLSYTYERDGAADFRPSGLMIADVDGDGQQEILTTSRKSGNRELVVIELIGELNAFAAFNIEYELGEATLGGGGIYDVDVADFDNDGKNEIWVNTWNNFSFTIIEAVGEDTYEVQADFNGIFPGGDPGSFNSHKLLFNDIDDDGRLELLLPMTNGRLYFLDDVDDVSQLTDNNFALVGTFVANAGNADARGADAGDLDGDANLDIIASHGGGEQISWIEYKGSGSPADSTNWTWRIILDSKGGPLDRYYPLRIADDLDDDGFNEVVLTNLFASEEGQPMVLVLEYNGTVVAVETDELPSDYALDQNYPNPFNPVTQIEYVLPEAGHATLRVFDVTGRLVRTLQDGVQAAGRYRAAWDGRTEAGLPAASGVYVYRLETPARALTRTMVLMK